MGRNTEEEIATVAGSEVSVNDLNHIICFVFGRTCFRKYFSKQILNAVIENKLGHDGRSMQKISVCFYSQTSNRRW